MKTKSSIAFIVFCSLIASLLFISNKIEQIENPTQELQKKQVVFYEKIGVYPKAAVETIEQPLTKYTIEVATTLTSHDAKSLVEELKSFSANCFYKESPSAKNTFTVNCGLFADHQTAVIEQKRLLSKNTEFRIQDAKVVTLN